MSRILLVLLVLAATAGAVVAYGDPDRIARAERHRFGLAAQTAPTRRRARVQISRGQTGEFALQARINGVHRADGDRYRRDLGGADL